MAGRAAADVAPLLVVVAALDLAALRTGAFSAAVRFAINVGFADLPLKVRFLVEDFAEDAELLLLRKLGREEDLFKPFTTGSLMGASTFKGSYYLLVGSFFSYRLKRAEMLTQTLR